MTRPTVVGVKPPEYITKALYMVNMAEDWRTYLAILFDVLCRAVDEWYTLKVVDEAQAEVM